MALNGGYIKGRKNEQTVDWRMQTLLEIKDLTKSFGAAPVLSGVTLALEKGKILGLAGENGAGKSTLARLISGRLKPDSGTIRLNGKCYVLPQEFAQIPTLSVFENMFLGKEPSACGLLKRMEMIRKTEEIFARLDFPIAPKAPVAALSVAEKQMLEIAKALLNQSDLMILDEPTTVLSKAEAARLFELLRELRDNGTSLIFVSHKLDEMIALCDEVAVLRDGVLVARDPVSELTPMDIAGKMVGRSLTQVFPPKTEVPPDAPVQFEVHDLSSADHVVKQVSFSVRKGEILGLAGLAGAGRTELAETICGLRRRKNGKILLNGQDLSHSGAGEVFRRGISYLSEDRQGTALLTEENLIKNTTLASLKNYLTFGFVNGGKERTSTKEYIQRFRIKCDSPDSLISSLSGGNQQKVAIAKGLDTHPHFFIFDEPTRGVDVGARREIYDFIHALAESGVSCLLISSDLEEVIGNCTRVLVMHNGTVRGEVSGADINEEEIIYYATGVK